MRSSPRPCSETSTVSGSGQPRRAAARLKADGAGTTSISSTGNAGREQRTHAIEKRIARGEHANLPPVLRQHLVHRARERARPGLRLALDERRREREMARAPEYDIGAGDEFAGGRREAVGPILADADDGQPASRWGSFRHDRLSAHRTHPHPWRHRRGATPRRRACRPTRARGDVCRSPDARRSRCPSPCPCGAAGSAAPKASLNTFAPRGLIC